MNLPNALDLAAIVFMAVLTGLIYLDEIINPGIRPKGSWKIISGTACAFFCAWAAFLAMRG